METLNLYLELQLLVIGMLLLIIYFMMESIPNALSELAYYADRQFYVDWWNAVTVEEFIQKWFKMPYIFYYRHITVRLVVKYEFNSTFARIVAFIVYSFSWEAVMYSLLGVK